MAVRLLVAWLGAALFLAGFDTGQREALGCPQTGLGVLLVLGWPVAVIPVLAGYTAPPDYNICHD